VNPTAKEIEKPVSRKFDPNEIFKRVMSHIEIRKFVQANPNILEADYRKALPKLSQYIKERENCLHCPGLDRCSNLMAGYTSVLCYEGGYIDLKMKPCEKLEYQKLLERRKQLIKSHYIPKDILDATFMDLEPDGERIEAIEQGIEFCYKIAKGAKGVKGLYLYGSFGVGKTRIAGAICNELAKHNIDSIMVYVPEFVNEIKSSIAEKTLMDKLQEYKKCSVLILDDIGAESLSPWIRDEVIGSILNFRMAEKLPTVFTSNLTLDQLEEHFSNTRNGVDELKAARIMERIRHNVIPIYVGGRNRRS
jgi:primosomal protein DnaI